jgi:hypothetical protein
MSPISSFRTFFSSTGSKYEKPSELSIDPAVAGPPSTGSVRERAKESTIPCCPYQYPPLNEARQEIRLVTLLPGEFQSDIHVSLTTVRATEHDVPNFESISYVWGPAEDPQTIFIGESGQETLSVTRNMREALPYLRDAKKPRVLWIDAICVNQKDLEERSSQVRRMAWIYSKAKRVIVWLGPASTDSHVALDCCNTVSSKINVDWWNDTMFPLSEESHWTDTLQKLPFDDTQNIAICNFFNRSWFEVGINIIPSNFADANCGTASLGLAGDSSSARYSCHMRSASDSMACDK